MVDGINDVLRGVRLSSASCTQVRKFESNMGQYLAGCCSLGENFSDQWWASRTFFLAVDQIGYSQQMTLSLTCRGAPWQISTTATVEWNKCKYTNPNIPVLYINAVGWIELRVKSRSLFSFWLGNINSSQFEEGTVGMIFSLGEKKVFTVDMSWNANEAQTSRAHLLLPVLSLWPPNQQWSAIY